MSTENGPAASVLTGDAPREAKPEPKPVPNTDSQLSRAQQHLKTRPASVLAGQTQKQ
jgi:hypothetical protein